MKIPTLDELLDRLGSKEARYPDQIREIYRQVAAGERHPTNPPLSENVIRLAAQSMVILFHHVDSQKKGESS